MSVSRFLLRRLLLVVPLLIFIAFFTFMLTRLGGQDASVLISGPNSTAEELDMIRAELGLDQPLMAQFWIYISNAVQGDLGISWVNNRPVLTDLLVRLPVTLELLFWGVGLGALIGIPLGLRAARDHNKRFDQVVRFFSLLGFSIPTYFLGLMMILIFFYFLGWSPPALGRISLMVSPPPSVTYSYLIDGIIAARWDVVQSAFSQLILPVIAMAIVASAPIIKQTRAIAMDVLTSEYVRTSEAAGLSRRVIQSIVARNSMTPIITFIGTELTALIGTASVLEFIFAWGGMGQYGLQAIIQGDFAAVQGYVLALALFSVLVFVIIDLVVFIIEPRADLTA